MKMIKTATAVAATSYTAYTHNCLRNKACEPSYTAPLPAVPNLELFVFFGADKPVTQEFILVDTCNGNQEQIFPSNYVIGQDPDGNWYGVFKYFNTPVDAVTTFVVWFSSIVYTGSAYVERTFFSEMLVIEPCAQLTKIKSCHPEQATSTGFDVNGVYYGLPQNLDYQGNGSVRYFHIAYVRNGKVKEISNKATFKSSLLRNFRTTVEKIHQLETELVPKWYKNVLLAIYSRGAISVNDGPTYLVSDLAIEPINEDDLMWKPFAQLKETFRLYFGCDESECVECCAPTVLSAEVVSSGGDESESGEESESPEDEGNIAVQSGFDQDGNSITDVSPLFFTITSGSFPINGTGVVSGNHAGFSGVISVTVVKPLSVPSATLRLNINASVVECIPVPSSGGYSFASVTINPGDAVFIQYFDDNC